MTFDTDTIKAVVAVSTLLGVLVGFLRWIGNRIDTCVVDAMQRRKTEADEQAADRKHNREWLEALLAKQETERAEWRANIHENTVATRKLHEQQAQTNIMLATLTQRLDTMIGRPMGGGNTDPVPPPAALPFPPATR